MNMWDGYMIFENREDKKGCFNHDTHFLPAKDKHLPFIKESILTARKRAFIPTLDFFLDILLIS